MGQVVLESNLNIRNNFDSIKCKLTEKKINLGIKIREELAMSEF